MWPSASKFWLWTFCLLSTLSLGYLILFHGFNYHAYIFTLKFWPRLQSYFPNFLSESYTGSIVGISGEHVRHRTLDPLLPNLMFCSFSCKLLETPFILCVHNHGVELDFILTSYIKASSLKKKKVGCLFLNLTSLHHFHGSNSSPSSCLFSRNCTGFPAHLSVLPLSPTVYYQHSRQRDPVKPKVRACLPLSSKFLDRFQCHLK